MDRFYDWFKKNGEINIWKDDQNGINDHINNDMAFGIENARLVLVFLTEPYFTSENCFKEINYADSLKRDLIIVKLQPGLNLGGRGAISLIANSKLYVRVSTTNNVLNEFRLSFKITKKSFLSALWQP